MHTPLLKSECNARKLKENRDRGLFCHSAPACETAREGFGALCATRAAGPRVLIRRSAAHTHTPNSHTPSPEKYSKNAREVKIDHIYLTHYTILEYGSFVRPA